MKQVINHEKAFFKLFNQTARYHRRHQSFEYLASSHWKIACSEIERIIPDS
ncbi:hypothetical protein RN053_00795 [Pantoea dispersa]|nr:hypothetical protein [Pantoea dispersa]MDT8849013.1 hypothetical protein [Pantoea dispersa]